jgi:lipopolysaccharide transport system ATP-binding protein
MLGTRAAISVRALSKAYRITHEAARPTTMAEALMQRLRDPLRRATHETFWALQDLSLDIAQGEVVGIIGRNGAGKSTFLKILSRITEPTSGYIDVAGRVGSLLEVGTGFHPELTGRENVYLNGQILGMRRREIDRQFDAIVDFAGVEQFLDTPVKRYSSGMYVRLAFAVAAHLDSDVLVVDEVLAVGDTEFQRKCLGKMGDVARSGRTVLFVSHNMAAISTLCGRGMLMHKGRLVFYGPTAECIDHYAQGPHFQRMATWERPPGEETAPLVVQTVSAALGGKQPALTLTVNVGLQSLAGHPPAFMSVDILDSGGVIIMQATPTLNRFITDAESRHEYEVKIELPPMIPGQYMVSVWVGSHNSETIDWPKECVGFEIDESPTTGRTYPHHPSRGYVVPNSRMRVLTSRVSAGVEVR